MRFVRYFSALSVFLVLSSAALAQSVPGTDFPYVQLQLHTPALENPSLGVGSNYSALSLGIDSLMWNPASLSKIQYTNVSFSTTNQNFGSYNRPYDTEDKQRQLGDQNNTNLYFFFTGDRSATTIATRENTAHALYTGGSSDVNFKQGAKVNDWLTLGFITHSNVGGSINVAGSLPVIGRFSGEYVNTSQKFGSELTVNIDNNGFTSLLITPEAGITYTKNLDVKLWDGFIHQSSIIPATNYVEARNDISLSSPWTIAGSAKYNKFSLGLSLTPISADCNINNRAWTVIANDATDASFYQPNFDSNNEQSILNWADDPNQYSTAAGYKRNTVKVPAGEVVAEARYQGFYQASASRIDLGATYDISEYFSVGLALENINSASLDFKGTGRAAYVNSRMGSFEAPVLDPNKEFSWQLFNDTFTPVSGTENYYLEEQLSSPLPKKIRIGAAFQKPFILAIDYEQNQTPIKFKYEDKTTKLSKIGTISNINLLRMGGQIRLFSLPYWIKGSTIVMFKPTAENVEQTFLDSLDKAFKFGVLPVGLELGGELQLWDTVIGDNFGFNLSPLMSLAQLDTLNPDLNKIVYYGIFTRYGQWQVSYYSVLDPGATADAYNKRADKNTKISGVGDALQYIRTIQTLTVSYSF